MKIIKLFTLLSLFLLACGNLFANTVASITAIKGSATIQRNSQSLQAVLGAKLKQSDNILTKDNTKIQLIFKDETIISIGKNSNFSINQYLYEDSKEPVAKFTLLKGAMRTITGKIGKIAPQKFSVSIRTATLGIRGTNFSVVVNEDGSYQAYCTYGKISVTINNQERIVKQDFYLSSSATGSVEIKEFTMQDLENMKKSNFGTKKNNQAQKNGSKIASNGGNNEQLDVTISDNSASIINHITDSASDSIQNLSQELTDSSVIAGYSMSNATYTGTYTTTYNDNANFLDSGSATLNIDFGADTATLNLGAAGKRLTYNESPSGLNTNKFTLGFETYPQNGTATSEFHGKTGNIIEGSFDYKDGTYKSKGNYNLGSSQTLH